MQATRPGALADFPSAAAHVRAWSRTGRVLPRLAAVLAAVLGSCLPASAYPPQAFVTNLTVAAGGNAVTTVATGTAVTLTAVTYTGPGARVLVSKGDVVFCDVPQLGSCFGPHLLASQPIVGGVAKFTFVPGIGVHTYYAFGYKGASTTSTAGSVTLTVTGIPSSVTRLYTTGNSVHPTLTAYVFGFGGSTPSGNVAYQDTSNANYVLGTAPLGTAAYGLFNSATLSSPYPAYTVAIADVNGDGIPDIVASSDNDSTATNNSLQTFLGNGDGTFTLKATSPLANLAGYLVTGDFNNDGIVDVAFTNFQQTSVTTLLGNGDGTFRAGTTITGLGGQVQEIAVGDFNGDGVEDLAASSLAAGGAGSAQVFVALGNGDGTFQAAQGTPLAGLSANSSGIAAADFNGDGVLDLAVSDTATNVTMLLGNGDGTYRVQPVTSGLNISANELRVADVNGDGIPDLLALDQGGPAFPPTGTSHVNVLLGNGDGTFTTGQTLQTGTPAPNTANSYGLAVGDFNADGIVDFAITDTNSFGGYGYDAVTLYLGRGDGTFMASATATPGAGPFQIVAGDLNGDGYSDVVTGNRYGLSVGVLLTGIGATSSISGVSVVGRGEHYVDAYFPGSTSVLPSTSYPVGLRASEVATALTLAASPTTSVQGQPVTLTTALTPNTAQNHDASGNVTFTYNGATLGSGSVASGSASFTTSALPAGTDCITATYAGDTNFVGSTFSQLCYVVNTAPAPQTITFPQPPAPAYASTSVYLNATANSGLPVTYTVVSGAATVSGNVLTYLQPGSVVVEADQAGDANHQPASPVQDTIAVTVLTEPVGTSSGALSTVITFLAAGTYSNTIVSTHGALNADFTAAPGGTCATGQMYAAGATCTAMFSFNPQHPGTRYGGITLSDANGTLLANSYLSGVGTGPTILYAPPSQTTIASGLSGSGGVAVDGVGNVYIADYYGAGIYQLAAGTGQLRLIAPATLAIDVDVDGSGNVFFATRSTVGEVAAVNGVIPASPTVRLFAGSTYGGALDGLKVDGSGNVFLAQGFLNMSGGSVFELPAVNGRVPDTPTVRTLITLGSPTGVAPDVYGDVFFSSQYDGSVYELIAVNGVVPANPKVLTITNSLGQPANVAFDITGNLYVPDIVSHDVKKLLAVNGVVPVNPVVQSLGTGLSTPGGAVVDAGGDLYVADEDLHDIVELAYGAPPTLTFASTPVNQTSSDSPQSVTLLNGGNANLVFFSANGQTSPYINSPDFTIASSTTCPLVQPGGTANLAPGATCAMAANFTPVALGPRSAELVFLNTNLNAANAAQIHLQGVGLGIPPAIVFTVPNHTFGDPPFAVAATSNSPGAITYSVVSGPASISGATVTLTGAGTVTLLASQAASGNYAAGTATAVFSVSKAPQTITFAQPTSPVPFGTQVTLVASASSGLPVVFSVISGPGQINGNLLTFSAAGTVVVAADQPGNNNFLPAPEVQRTILVSYGPAAITLTAAPNPVFFSNPLTLSASISGAGGAPTGSVQFQEGTTVLGTAAISGGTASLTTATLSVGQHYIVGVYSGDANFSSVTSVPVLVVVQDFRVTIQNPTVVIDHGGTAVFNLVVSSIGGVGLASSIHLSMSGGPDHAVNTFSATDIATGSGYTAVTLTVQTPNYPTGPFGRLQHVDSGARLACLLLCALPVGLWRKRKQLSSAARPLLLGVLLCVSAAAAGLLSGCGSGWRTQGWSLTVNATSGNLQRSATATITSQCANGAVACPIQ